MKNSQLCSFFNHNYINGKKLKKKAVLPLLLSPSDRTGRANTFLQLAQVEPILPFS